MWEEPKHMNARYTGPLDNSILSAEIYLTCGNILGLSGNERLGPLGQHCPDVLQDTSPLIAHSVL